MFVSFIFPEKSKSSHISNVTKIYTLNSVSLFESDKYFEEKYYLPNGTEQNLTENHNFFANLTNNNNPLSKKKKKTIPGDQWQQNPDNLLTN